MKGVTEDSMILKMERMQHQKSSGVQVEHRENGEGGKKGVCGRNGKGMEESCSGSKD